MNAIQHIIQNACLGDWTEDEVCAALLASDKPLRKITLADIRNHIAQMREGAETARAVGEEPATN